MFVTVAIIGNTFVLCFDYEGISKTKLRDLEIADFSFSLIFISELFFKLWAKGFQGYTNKVLNYLCWNIRFKIN